MASLCIIHTTRFNIEISTLSSPSAFMCRHVSQNKHRFFPWSALTNWVLQPRYRMFTVRYNLSIYTPFRLILFFTVLTTRWPIIKLSLHGYFKYYMKTHRSQHNKQQNLDDGDDNNNNNIPGKHEVKEPQKTAIMGSAHIIRKVLMWKYNRFNTETNDISTMISNSRIAATLYSLGT